MARSPRKNRKMDLDINPVLMAAFVLLTILIGCVCFLVTEFAYQALTEALWRPLAIALYFLIFGFVFFLLYFLINVFTGTVTLGASRGTTRSTSETRMRTKERRRTQTGPRSYSSRQSRRRGSGSNDVVTVIPIIACVAVAFFCIALLFEFLYELGKQKYVEPTSYIFVIDDSGSMTVTDPQFKRVEAIRDIMTDADPDLEYAVYKFTSYLTPLKDMSVWNKDDSFEFSSEGNTDIIGALSGVLDDLESGKIDGGDYPRILLLSDGNSLSYGKDTVIKRCRKNAVSISTVSFPDSNSLLKTLAEKTGGVYISSSDSNQINETMKEAITSSLTRDLLSYRFVDRLDGLYAFLRIFFLVVLGIIWSGMKYAVSGSVENGIPATIVFIVSAGLCILAAVFMEMTSQMYSGIVTRLWFVLMWSLSVGQLMIQSRKRRRKTGGASLA